MERDGPKVNLFASLSEGWAVSGLFFLSRINSDRKYLFPHAVGLISAAAIGRFAISYNTNKMTPQYTSTTK
jgi:hypothetical protein